MSPATLLQLLEKENEYKLAKAWRLTDNHLTVVVPIVRAGKASERGYRLIEEVKDSIKISDSGGIAGVRITGATAPVLARSGVILEGVGTQNRCIETSIIILPEAVVTVPVKCVFASHPIRPGAPMEVSEMYAPETVHSAMLATGQGGAGGGQGAVWDSVSYFCAASTPQLMRRASSSPTRRAESMMVGHDDLLGTVRAVQEARQDIDAVISKMPIDLLNQVGLIVMNVEGVVGLEMFDHPDSWTAASKAVARKYADVLTAEGKSQLFELKEGAVHETALVFIKQAIAADEKVISENRRASTRSFKFGEFVGERVIFDEREIHVILTKHRPQAGSGSRLRNIAEASSAWAERRRTQQSPRPHDSDEYAPMSFLSMAAQPSPPAAPQERALFDLLTTKPRPWSELENTFQKAHMSTKTLSKTLKEAQSHGLVERAMRTENGKVLYRLTPQGEKEAIRKGLSR